MLAQLIELRISTSVCVRFNNVKHIKRQQKKNQQREEFHYASFRVHGNFVPFDFLLLFSFFLSIRVVLHRHL